MHALNSLYLSSRRINKNHNTPMMMMKPKRTPITIPARQQERGQGKGRVCVGCPRRERKDGWLEIEEMSKNTHQQMVVAQNLLLALILTLITHLRWLHHSSQRRRHLLSPRHPNPTHLSV